MPQSIWSGSISFGLVMLPVKLYPATRSRDVRFHEFDPETGRRVRHRRVIDDPGADLSPAWADEPSERAVSPQEPPRDADTAAAPSGLSGAFDEERRAWRSAEDGAMARSEREVPYGDVALGYELEPGRTVLLTRDEIRALRQERSRTVEIEEFVDLASIDPVYFEKSYIAVPQAGSGGERAYALLVAAMEHAGKVGIGRIVLRTKEHLAAIRSSGGVVLLETLFHADEVRDPAEVYRPPPSAADGVTARELRIAEQLIGILAAEWDPSRHEDRDRARVMELIERRAAEGGFVTTLETEPSPGQEVPSNVTDLMAALRESVEAIKARGSEDRRTG